MRNGERSNERKPPWKVVHRSSSDNVQTVALPNSHVLEQANLLAMGISQPSLLPELTPDLTFAQRVTTPTLSLHAFKHLPDILSSGNAVTQLQQREILQLFFTVQAKEFMTLYTIFGWLETIRVLLAKNQLPPNFKAVEPTTFSHSIPAPQKAVLEHIFETLYHIDSERSVGWTLSLDQVWQVFENWILHHDYFFTEHPDQIGLPSHEGVTETTNLEVWKQLWLNILPNNQKKARQNHQRILGLLQYLTSPTAIEHFITTMINHYQNIAVSELVLLTIVDLYGRELQLSLKLDFVGSAFDHNGLHVRALQYHFPQTFNPDALKEATSMDNSVAAIQQVAAYCIAEHLMQHPNESWQGHPYRFKVALESFPQLLASTKLHELTWDPELSQFHKQTVKVMGDHDPTETEAAWFASQTYRNLATAIEILYDPEIRTLATQENSTVKLPNPTTHPSLPQYYQPSLFWM